ncbi:MAG: hypothetical protein AAGA48_03330 [Myxococcota bacterium]
MVTWIMMVAIGCGGIGQTAPQPSEVNNEPASASPKTLRDLVMNPDALARAGRVVPQRNADGDVVGFRIGGLRRSVLGEQLDLVNGDVIHSVNGHALTSPKEALTAYQSIKDAEKLVLTLTREGTPRTISVDLSTPVSTDD